MSSKNLKNAVVSLGAVALWLLAWQDVQAAMLAYWPANDATGWTVTNTVSSDNNAERKEGAGWTTGQFGSAMAINAGIVDHFNVLNPASLNIGTGDFTYSLWTKIEQTDPGGFAWFVNQNGNNYSPEGQGLFILTQNRQIRVFMGGWGADVFPDYASDPTLSGTGYHNIVVTRTGTSMKLYLNGALIDTGTSSAYIGAAANGMLFGIGPGPEYGGGWIGGIDDVALWNAGLNAGEAKSLTSIVSVLSSYSAGKMDNLFKVYDGSLASYTDGALVWTKATGLTGHNEGDSWRANGMYYVQLDASGNGVSAIPEPSTIALIATGFLGLLCYAWRRRK